MQWNKVVLKTVGGTLGAMAILFAFMFGMMYLCFPSTLMELSYDVGSTRSAVKYAERAYKVGNDGYYLSYAIDYSRELKDSKNVEKYCILLYKEKNFEDICSTRDKEINDKDGQYEQYFYLNYCVAMYQNGKRAESNDFAFSKYQNSFPRNNAVSGVLIQAISASDWTTTDSILSKLEELRDGNGKSFSQEDQDYIIEMIIFAKWALQELQ